MVKGYHVMSKLFNKTIPELANEIDQFSIAIEDLRTLPYFILFHEIKEEPRKTHQLVVEHLIIK